MFFYLILNLFLWFSSSYSLCLLGDELFFLSFFLWYACLLSPNVHLMTYMGQMPVGVAQTADQNTTKMASLSESVVSRMIGSLLETRQGRTKTRTHIQSQDRDSNPWPRRELNPDRWLESSDHRSHCSDEYNFLLPCNYKDWIKSNGNSLIFLTWLYSQGYNIYVPSI